MKTKYYSYLLIILINSLLLMSACATDIRPIGQQIDDKKNQSVLQGKYNDKHVFDSSNISVNIYYGTALLTGQTKQQKQKEEAENLAKSTVGINKVYNYIIIGQPISIAAASTDTIITTKIIAKMFNNSKVDSNKIKIVTSNKVVYVMGMLSHQEAEEITRIISYIPNVTKVVVLFSYLD